MHQNRQVKRTLRYKVHEHNELNMKNAKCRMFIKRKTFNTSTLFLFSNTQKSLRMDAGLISAP